MAKVTSRFSADQQATACYLTSLSHKRLRLELNFKCCTSTLKSLRKEDEEEEGVSNHRLHQFLRLRPYPPGACACWPTPTGFLIAPCCPVSELRRKEDGSRSRSFAIANEVTYQRYLIGGVFALRAGASRAISRPGDKTRAASVKKRECFACTMGEKIENKIQDEASSPFPRGLRRSVFRNLRNSMAGRGTVEERRGSITFPQ